VKVGVWERGKFVGVVLFSRGANESLGSPYGLGCTECCELVRVALSRHEAPVSRVVAIAIRFLKKSSPLLRLIVSFADPERGHIGGIYQAGNWIYCGRSSGSIKYQTPEGRTLHKRQVSATGRTKKFGKTKGCYRFSDCKQIKIEGKYRYLMPLDDEMRNRVLKLAKPYPKKPRAGSIDVDASGHQPEEGGSTPTPALNSSVRADV